MTTVQIIKQGEVTEASFEKYSVAKKHYEACVAELAPKAERHHSVSDIDYLPTNVIHLMRGRFVEEWVEF